MHPYVRYAIIAVVLIGGYRWYGSYERQAQTQFVELSQTFDPARAATLLEERMRYSGGIPAEARDVTATSEVVSVNGIPTLRFRLSFTAAGGQVVLNPSAEFVSETLLAEAKKAAGASRIDGRVTTQFANGQPAMLLVIGKAWFSEWQRAGMPAVSTSSLPSIIIPSMSIPNMPSMPAIPSITIPSITIPSIEMPSLSMPSHIRLPSVSVGDTPIIGSAVPVTPAPARRTDDATSETGTPIRPR